MWVGGCVWGGGCGGCMGVWVGGCIIVVAVVVWQ